MKNIMLKVAVWLENHPKTVLVTLVFSWALIVAGFLRPPIWGAAILGAVGAIPLLYLTSIMCRMTMKAVVDEFFDKKKKED